MSNPIKCRVDFSGALAKLRSIAPRVKKVQRPIIERAARLGAISAATSTQPYGNGFNSKIAGENAVARDITKIYTTPARIFPEIKALNPRQAAAFWTYIQAGNFKRAEGIYLATVSRRMGGNIPWGPFDGGALHRSARKSRGRVPEKQARLLVVTNPKALQKYVKKMQKLVGFAKGAWANIARELGGTRGIRSKAILDDGSPDITAQWILRHKTAPMMIVRRGGENDNNQSVTMTSRVDYASDTLTDSEKKKAQSIAIDRLKKNLLIAARYEAKDALRRG